MSCVEMKKFLATMLITINPHVGLSPILSSQSPISPFKRIRHDHASETAENYVEAIAELISINGWHNP